MSENEIHMYFILVKWKNIHFIRGFATHEIIFFTSLDEIKLIHDKKFYILYIFL